MMDVNNVNAMRCTVVEGVSYGSITLDGTTTIPVPGGTWSPYVPIVNPWPNTGGCPGFAPNYPTPIPPDPVPVPVPSGWKCPGCGRFYAPNVMACECQAVAQPEPDAVRPDDTSGPRTNRRIKA